MLLMKLSERRKKAAKIAKQLALLRKTINQDETTVEEKTKEAGEVVYPEITDLSYEGRFKYKRLNYCEQIAQIPTVEEKLFKVNVPRYYGWRPSMITENLPYNMLPSAQYLTKTHLVPTRSLPSCYDHMTDPSTLSNILSKVRSQIEDVLTLELNDRRHDNISLKDKTDKCVMERIKTKSLVQQINRVISTELSENYTHLIDTEMDYDPRLESFWSRGNIYPTKEIIKVRSKSKYDQPKSDNPMDIKIQYVGNPLIHLRHSLPLREIISIKESEDSALEIPEYRYHPMTLGIPSERRHVTNIPGFWPGHQNEFGLLSYHHRAHEAKDLPNTDETLIAQAIFASFGWLMSQACYQGFSPYNDITYPLVNQMVITNGQMWSFYVYQLNTTYLCHPDEDAILKRNICWATEPLKLYETIENGKVQGFNDDILKYLIKFYINVPEQRDYDIKPLLNTNAPYIACYEDDHKREWLEKHFKYLMSLRRRHRPMPEILQWQKIFMIDNKTRPMEKKREPWEFGVNPYRRRMDEHTPKYVPKSLRAHPDERKWYKWEKWEKTYYP